MKKITIVFYITLMIACAACDREYDGVFQELPDQRVQAVMKEYNALLTDAPYGWKASLYTGSGAGYFYYFDFKNDGTVDMLSDFDSQSAGEVIESTWVLKALQRTTLSFTTYSYVHLPADPDGDVNNGLPGSGLLSDFEFAITKKEGDTVMMMGLQHKAELLLVRATEAEQQAYLERQIESILDRTADFLSLYKGYRLSLPNGIEVPMALSIEQKLISFQYLDTEGAIQSSRTSYTFTPQGISLRTPIIVLGNVIQALLWDEQANSYSVVTDNGSIPLIGTDEPYIFSPTEALYSLFGQRLVTIVIPPVINDDPLPGQSAEFIEAYKHAATAMLESEYRLTLQNIRYIFVPNTDRMLMVLEVWQPVTGGGVAQFSAQYTYSYQLREGGLLKFKLEGMDQNGSVLYPEMSGILMHFDNDTFRSEYIGGDFQLIAGFFSQEERGYHFSGYIVE